MYTLTDEQVEYILCDIRRNGVEMEDLQLNLLDHICCILERDLRDGDDFEAFYHATVRQFYRQELREIEVETIHLLTFKNYYKMKKIMLGSGAVSVAAFMFGSFLKIMHWPGASVTLIFAMLVLSLVFIPLLAMLKVKESPGSTDKAVAITGSLVGVLYIVSTMFAIMHWEGRTALWLTTVGTCMFVFLPVYLYKGLQQSETKLNTIITSVLVVGFALSVFTMIRIH
jgi:hypothetical protein